MAWTIFVAHTAVALACCAALLFVHADAKPIRCPLVWKSVGYDGRVPVHSVPVEAYDQYVCRVGLTIGRTAINTGCLHVDPNGSGQVLTEYQYEVLSNVHGCLTSWERWVEDPDLTVTNNGTVGEYCVGKVEYQLELGFLAGSVNSGLRTISFVDPQGTACTATEYLSLISYSVGLSLEINSFILEKDPAESANLDFIGYDEISNRAGVQVSYSVTFEKTVRNSYSFSEGGSCKSTWGLASKVSLTLFGVTVSLGAGGEVSYGDSWEKTMSTDTTQALSVTKEVVIPGNQEVEICSSTRTTPDGFQTNYTAQADYSAPGWTAQDIIDYLKHESGFENLIVKDELTASRAVTGMFQGSFAMSTSVRVTRKGDPNGCGAAIAKQRAARKAKAQHQRTLLQMMPPKTKTRKLRFAGLPESPDPTSITFELYNRNVPRGEYVFVDSSRTELIGAGFKSGQNLVLITHGWTSSSAIASNLATEILSTHDYNVILVDWHKLANPVENPVLSYPMAVLNTFAAGEMIALLTKRIVDSQLITFDKVHLIGHSLGAHVMGHAGRALQGRAGRVTGLDPAGPLFVNYCEGTKLDRTDGQYVDIMHTNGGSGTDGLGHFDPMGHVDFYPNGGRSQPACDDEIVGISSCAHNRVWPYLEESVRTTVGFKACNCRSYTEYNTGACACDKPALMEFNLERGLSGNYYLNTSGSKPWALT